MIAFMRPEKFLMIAQRSFRPSQGNEEVFILKKPMSYIHTILSERYRKK